jgi:predicted ATPase
MSDINQYNPFPWRFRGDKEDGTYCEIKLDNEHTRFIAISVIPYMQDNFYERQCQLVAQGVTTWSNLYPETKKLGYMPDRDKVFWLYKVYVDDIENEFLVDDVELFATKAKNCKSFVFDDFYKCMAFLKEHYHVEEKDFKKLGENNYPRH